MRSQLTNVVSEGGVSLGSVISKNFDLTNINMHNMLLFAAQMLLIFRAFPALLFSSKIILTVEHITTKNLSCMQHIGRYYVAYWT